MRTQVNPDSSKNDSAQAECQCCVDEATEIRLKSDDFPFKRSLSLSPLIDYWRDTILSAPGHMSPACTDWVQSELAKAPELAETITDTAVIDRNQDLIRALMSVVFPAATWETEAIAAIMLSLLDRWISRMSEMRRSHGFPLNVAVRSDVGRVRTNNEDSFGLR